ncbi:MAG: amidohydrolase family protein [Bacteroidia bacterium]
MAQNPGCLRPLLIGIIALTSFSIAAWYLLFATNLYEPPEKAEEAIFFENAWIWDGEADSLMLGDVLVEGTEITCVGSGCVSQSGTLKVDATGKTLMPGLIDLHLHYYAPSLENKGMNAVQQLPDYIKQRPEVRKNLVRHGITSIRCVGDITDNILQLRRQVQEGEFAGPRIYVSGGFLTAPGGHPVSTLFAGNEMLIENACFQLATEDDAIAAVATLKSKGVNGLKIVYTKGPNGALPRLDLKVLDVIIEEAEKAGLWVAVHALSRDDLADLVERPVTSIEHASLAEIDSSLIEKMLQNDIAFIPTMVHTMPQNASQLKQLADRGIMIGTGSDTQGEMLFGKSLLQEISLLHTEGGLSRTQALRAATLDAARIMRIDHLAGKITKGKKADILLVEGNVLDSLPTQTRILSVLIDGKIMKWNGKLYE